MLKDESGITISQQLIVVAVIVAIAGAGVSFFVYKYDQGGKDTEPKPNESGFSVYTNEKYGFSFPYPSDWILDNMERFGRVSVLAYENSLTGQPKAGVQILAGALGYPSLDNLKGIIQSSIDNMENNENIQLIGELEEITINSVPGFDFSYKQTQKAGTVRKRTLILKKDNSSYQVAYFVLENYFEDYQPVLEAVFDNLSV